jgi:Zn-dependent membrane protease YugP
MLLGQKVNRCGIIIPPASLRSDFSSVYEASSYVDEMLERINWKENFQLQEQNGIDNAYATIIRNQRYIIYDNRFLESLDRYAGTKWASISVLAHEMGHHYRNHVAMSWPNWAPVLQRQKPRWHKLHRHGPVLHTPQKPTG